jgi:hypothetical protein
MLLQSRKLILEHAGFDVVSCEAERAVAKLREDPRAMHAAVIGQSIDLDDRIAIAQEMRRIAEHLAIVLMHYPGDRFDASVCDSVVETLSPPDALVRAVRRALRRRGWQ